MSGFEIRSVESTGQYQGPGHIIIGDADGLLELRTMIDDAIRNGRSGKHGLRIECAAGSSGQHD